MDDCTAVQPAKAMLERPESPGDQLPRGDSRYETYGESRDEHAPLVQAQRHRPKRFVPKRCV